MKLIPLTQGKFAQVDDEDFERVNQFKWCASKFKWCASKFKETFYASRKTTGVKPRKIIYMHRFIMEENNSSVFIDHEDRDGLNCKRNNLRRCNRSQNSANSKSTGLSKYKGVIFSDRENCKKWRAHIRFEGKRIHLGCFPNTLEGEIEAAKAYDKKAKELHREFANLNFK